MANFASLRGPVGLNRTYVNINGALTADAWLDGLKRGHTFATNGPLLGFRVQDRIPGDELRLPAGKHSLRYSVSLRSIVPVDHLEIVVNGSVARALDLAGDRTSADLQGEIPVDQSGWVVLRAWNEKASDLVLDLYPYASTSPIYVTVDGKAPHSAEDAAYFKTWIDHMIESAEAHPDYNTPEEKEVTLRTLRDARAKFE
jgi:hypothetical protein